MKGGRHAKLSHMLLFYKTIKYISVREFLKIDISWFLCIIEMK